VPDSSTAEADRYRALFEASADPILVADAEGRFLDANPAALALLGYARDEILALRVADVSALAPSALDDEYARLLREGEWWGEADLLRKDGSLVSVEIRAERLVLPASTIYVATFHDIGEQGRERWLPMAYALSRVLADGRDPQTVAPSVLRQITAGLGFDAAVLWIGDERAGLLRCAGVMVAADRPSPAFAAACRRATFARGQGVPGRVWARAQPLRVSFRQLDDDVTRLEAALAAGLTAVLGYPIRAGREVAGVIECFTSRERGYDAEVVRMLRAIGGQLGLFVERHRTEAALQQLATGLFQSRDEERRRLARDLHEASTLTLAALGSRLEQLAELLHGTGGDVLAVLAETRELNMQGLREVGALAGLLRPASPEEAGPGSPDMTALLTGKGPIFQAVSASSPTGIFLMDGHGRCTYTNPRYQAITGVSLEASHGDGWLSSIHPDERAASVAAWRTAAREGKEYSVERRIIRPDGAVRWVHARAAPLHSEPGELIGFVGTLEDVSERVEAQQLVTRRLAALTDIAATLAVDQPMAATLGAMATIVVEVTEADTCAITLHDEATGAIRVVGAANTTPGLVAEGQAAYTAGGPTFTLQVFREGRPLLVRDIRRRLLDDPARAALHAVAAAMPWDTVLYVPVRHGGQSLGVLNAGYLPGPAPKEDEVAFLGAVADQAGVAITAARRSDESQRTTAQAAALEERQRLARELHDSVSQVLYGIGMGASAARGWLDTDPQQAIEPIEYVLSLVEAGIAEMRALIFELRPDSLAQEGLVAALDKLAAVLPPRYGLTVEASLSEEPDVSLEIKEALYRVGQEAMHNAARHSRASRVEVQFEAGPNALILTVGDNGIGFNPTAEFPGHLGLRSMRERIERLGGVLSIESTPRNGSRIRAEVPR
jgi:PAS domain S-box-containing protein